MNIPSYASHYYLPENGPFKSLSELPNGSENQVFQELLTKPLREPGYRRRFGLKYIEKRKYTEGVLRELFIKRGGKPKREYPFYLMLGESAWFKGLNENHQQINIPLSQLNPESTSLTFPDSFMTVSRPDKPYYNQVFLLTELTQMIDRFGLPQNDHLVPYEKYWETDFELYIEIQVWDSAESLLSI